MPITVTNEDDDYEEEEEEEEVAPSEVLQFHVAGLTELRMAEILTEEFGPTLGEVWLAVEGYADDGILEYRGAFTGSRGSSDYASVTAPVRNNSIDGYGYLRFASGRIGTNEIGSEDSDSPIDFTTTDDLYYYRSRAFARARRDEGRRASNLAERPFIISPLFAALSAVVEEREKEEGWRMFYAVENDGGPVYAAYSSLDGNLLVAVVDDNAGTATTYINKHRTVRASLPRTLEEAKEALRSVLCNTAITSGDIAEGAAVPFRELSYTRIAPTLAAAALPPKVLPKRPVLLKLNKIV